MARAFRLVSPCIVLVLAACRPNADDARPCTPDGEPCDPGTVCIDQACYKVCQQPSDCPKSDVCRDGACRPGAGECSADSDCRTPPEPCLQEMGICEGGQCLYADEQDGAQCQVELGAANQVTGTCSGGECVVLCSPQGDCPQGLFCDGTLCRLLLGLGEDCREDGWCASGICREGYCCDSACTDTCQTCNPELSGVDGGGCAPVADGREKQDECTGAVTCDGSGACYAGELRDDCVEDYQCYSGNCAAGICADNAPLGDDCSDNFECRSGLCVAPESWLTEVSESLCCDSRCRGPCRSCSAQAPQIDGGDDGVCTPLQEGVNPGESCASAWGCNGQGECHPLAVTLQPLPEITNAFPRLTFTSNAVAPEYECRVDTGEPFDCTPDSAGADELVDVQLGRLAPGTHTFSVTARSATNDTATTATGSVEFEVDDTLPVGVWRFETGAESTAFDATTSKNDGILMDARNTQGNGAGSGPTWTTNGVFGKGMLFSGNADDHVLIPASPSLANTPSFTIAGWVQFASPADTFQAFANQNAPNDGSSPYNRMMLDANMHPFYDAIEHEDRRLRSVNLEPGRFYHYAMTYDGAQAKVFINGRLADQWRKDLDAPDLSSSPLRFGIGDQLQYELNGVIDEARLFAYARSPQQVLADASAMRFSFDGSEDLGVVDAGPFNNHGTIQNGNGMRAQGVRGKGLQLAGDAHVNLGSGTPTRFDEGLTISVWVRPEQTATTAEIVARSQGESGYSLTLEGSEAQSCQEKLKFSINGLGLCSASTIPADRWTHVAATYDRGKMVVSVNGKPESIGEPDTGGSINLPAETPLTVGRGFSGTLDELAFFPAARNHAPRDCQAIAETGVFTDSGIYWIDPDKDGNPANAFGTYCEMARDGGGWTLVLNADRELDDVRDVDVRTRRFSATNMPCTPEASSATCGFSMALFDFAEVDYREVGPSIDESLFGLLTVQDTQTALTSTVLASVGDSGQKGCNLAARGTGSSKSGASICGLLTRDSYDHTVALHLLEKASQSFGETTYSYSARRYSDAAQFSSWGCAVGQSCSTPCTQFNTPDSKVDTVGLSYHGSASYRENVDGDCNTDLYQPGTLGANGGGGTRIPTDSRIQIWVR